jgi:Na+-transporting NADH:ubiquinone oxidoreductase subunit NqrC
VKKTNAVPSTSMGEKTLIRMKAVLKICLCLMVFATGSAYSAKLTCEECRELDKQRAQAQLELSRKERQMDRAFKKKEYRKVRTVRAEMTELRRTILSLQSKEPQCKIACRPDVVKQAKCRRIVEELVALDKGDPVNKEEQEEIEKRYRELAACNRELAKLRELHEKPVEIRDLFKK